MQFKPLREHRRSTGVWLSQHSSITSRCLHKPTWAPGFPNLQYSNAFHLYASLVSLSLLIFQASAYVAPFSGTGLSICPPCRWHPGIAQTQYLSHWYSKFAGWSVLPAFKLLPDSDFPSTSSYHLGQWLAQGSYSVSQHIFLHKIVLVAVCLLRVFFLLA